jgi:DNA-binding MarR family transcriptional regulator
MARGYSRTEAGAALMDMLWLTVQTGFKIRALGRRTGFVSARGGVWGLLRSLKMEGPQTVPALARTRPVSRQHIQTLADAMAADGLIAFKPNPAHKRSPLMTLTAKGDQVYEALAKKLAALSDDLAAGMDARKIAAAGEALGQLAAKLDSMLGGADVAEDEEAPRKRKTPHAKTS